MSEVRVDAEPTPNDISAAVWGDVLGGWRVFAPLITGGAFALMMSVLVPWQHTLEGVIRLIEMGVFFGAGMSLYLAALFWIGARRLSAAPGMLDKVSFVFSEAGLEASSPRRSVRADWTYWRRAYETNSVLVVCGQANAFYVLPKRQLAPHVLRSLRSLLRQALNGRVRFQSETAA